MLIKCERCGAPLEVHPSQTSYTCQYCGTTVAVPQAAQPAPQPMPMQVRVQVVPPTYQPAAGSKVVVTLVSIIAVVGALVGVVVPLIIRNTVADSISTGSGSSGSTPARSSDSSRSWSASPPGCFIDANGDGVLDIAGLSGTSGGDNTTPTVVDGSSGKVLWAGSASPKYPQFACLGRDRSVVSEPTFQLDFYTARSPWGVTHVMGRDKIDEVGFGTNCARIKTDDGTTMNVQLPSGVAADCAISGPMRRLTADVPGMLGLTDKSTELTAGIRKYTMTKRASGTEILTITVNEGTRQIWSHEIAYAACTFDSGIAVAGDKIVLWVAKAADQHEAFIVGLDEKTGNQVYEHKVPDTSSNSPEMFAFNGRYVIGANWGALRAYEPSTGNEVWRMGR